MKVGSLPWFESEIEYAIKQIKMLPEGDEKAEWVAYLYELQEKQLKFKKEVADMANQERDRDIKELDIRTRYEETKMQCKAKNKESGLKFLGTLVGGALTVGLFLVSNKKRGEGEYIRDDDVKATKGFMGLFDKFGR